MTSGSAELEQLTLEGSSVGGAPSEVNMLFRWSCGCQALENGEVRPCSTTIGKCVRGSLMPDSFRKMMAMIKEPLLDRVGSGGTSIVMSQDRFDRYVRMGWATPNGKLTEKYTTDLYGVSNGPNGPEQRGHEMDSLNQLTYQLIAEISTRVTPRHGDGAEGARLWGEVREVVAQGIVDAVELGAREAMATSTSTSTGEDYEGTF